MTSNANFCFHLDGGAYREKLLHPPISRQVGGPFSLDLTLPSKTNAISFAGAPAYLCYQIHLRSLLMYRYDVSECKTKIKRFIIPIIYYSIVHYSQQITNHNNRDDIETDTAFTQLRFL